MAEAESQTEVQTVTLEWMQITNGVAQGSLAPEEGIAALQALAEAHPAERDWLQAEAEMIRCQFGLDIATRIREGAGSYWDKLLSVIEALLDEHLDHERALVLLETIHAQHPEHTETTAALISNIKDSPLRQFLEMDD